MNEILTNELIERIDSAIEKIREIMEEVSDKIAKVLNQIVDIINIDEISLKIPHKLTHNYAEYNYTKPNAKPYSAFKRLYRVQAR